MPKHPVKRKKETNTLTLTLTFGSDKLYLLGLLIEASFIEKHKQSQQF